MKQITLNISDNRFAFFMELLRNFSFVSVAKKSEKTSGLKKEVAADLTDALRDMDLYMKGKIKLKSLDEALNEL